MTDEREFPAAFRRRCLPLELRIPTRELLLATNFAAVLISLLVQRRTHGKLFERQK
mgnify:CR=1 FL=1